MEKNIREHKGNSLTEFVDEFVVIDIETTGLMPKWDEIIEVAGIHVKNNEIVGKYSQLLKPKKPVDAFITELTGITNEMLKDAPRFKDVAHEYIGFIGDRVIVGHNVNFDINFLYDNLFHDIGHYFKNDYIDYLRFSRRLDRGLKNNKLATIAKYYDIDTSNSHRALGDCEITLEALNRYKVELLEKGLTTNDLFISKGKGGSPIDISSIVTNNTEFDEEHLLFNKVCVFTGKLEKMIRKDAMQCVVDLGGQIGKAITSKTNYLVLGNNDYCSSIKDGKSSKHKKAEKLILEGADLMIIPEDVFYDLI